MRIAHVFRNGRLAGVLTQHNPKSYTFRYTKEWFRNPALPPISLTLPKTQQEYRSNHLFPFFFNMLSEGENKALQCRLLKIDENDYFGLLLATSTKDTIGAVTVEPAESAE